MLWLLLQWTALLAQCVAFHAGTHRFGVAHLPRGRRTILWETPSSTDARTLSSPDVSVEVTGSSHAGGVVNGEDRRVQPLTTALLRVSYDGLHFTGWSCANDKASKNSTPRFDAKLEWKARSRRRQRQSTTPFRFESPGFVRSVQGEIRCHLARLFGNIDVERIIVEGCSRTDKGVHAMGMVAQIYCLTEAAYAESRALTETRPITNTGHRGEQPSIPGKRIPYPWNATDSTCFVPFPKPLPDLVSALNRMMSPDVQIMAMAAVSQPSSDSTKHSLPFHPTLSSRRKTYRYIFSIGPRHDPISWRSVWHLHDSGDGSTWDDSLMHEAAEVLCGQHSFSAFQGAPRGPDDKRRRIGQNTRCTIDTIIIRVISTEDSTVTYTMDITGDRFLYKMVRLLTGALVAVGRKKLSLLDIEHLLSAGSRKDAPEFECAPAHGLVMFQVEYDEPINWSSAVS